MVAPRSRRVLIMVDQVTATLASCVTAFDALKLFVEGLQVEQSMKLLERLRWSSKWEDLQSFQLKIEAHKATLTLMLTILTCQKQDDAEDKVDALRTEIDGLKALNAQILARMDMWDLSKIQPGVRTYSYSYSIQVTGGHDAPAVPVGSADPAQRPSIDHSNPSVTGIQKDSRGFAFEELLQNSRAYRSAAHNNSDVFSVSTSAGRTATWSMLSGLSLSEMSNIAILAIPVYQTDLHDKQAYDFEPPRTDIISNSDRQESEAEGAQRKGRLSAKFKGWLRKPSDEAVRVDSSDRAPAASTFGVPLTDSVRIANVAISTFNDSGEAHVYGHIPVVVGKAGVFIKDKGVDVANIFAQSGHATRLAELQTVFNSPPRYGRGLDWTGYTVHDAANILFRYLKSLPQPVVPYDSFDRFAQPIIAFQRSQAGVDQDEATSDQYHITINDLHRCIVELPALNRQLLIYMLDILAVIASKSDRNQMTAQRLASVLNPGIVSGLSTQMDEEKHLLALETLVFLIENQDHFLIGFEPDSTRIGEVVPKTDSKGAIVPYLASSPAADVGKGEGEEEDPPYRLATRDSLELQRPVNKINAS